MKTFWVYFKTEWSRMFEYRADFVVYTLGTIISPFIGLAIWLAISSSSTGLIYSSNELIIYFILAALINILTSTWGAYFIGARIKRGEFSNYLLKPTSFVYEWISNNLVEKVYKIVILFILIFFFIILTGGIPVSFYTNYQLIFLAILSIIMGGMINFILDLFIGISAFWLDEIEVINGINKTLGNLFSGKIIPLVFLPGFIGSFVIYLPYRYLISFPIEIILGKLSWEQIFFGFFIETIWLVCLYLLYKLIYFFGVKNYQSFGG